MRPSIVRLFVAVGVILMLPVIGSAQEATVSGAVTDSTGGVLPGVTITAIHEASGNTFVAVTNERGEYRLPLRTGVYKLTGELPGFTTVTKSGLELLIGQQAVVSLQMSPSSVQESVTVTGEAPLVDVSQSKLGGNIDTRQMQELPVNGRNWLQLTMLAPGSRANAAEDSPMPRDMGAFQLNVDGQQVTDIVSVSTNGNPRFSRDAIGEFELISNRFDATQGRSSGVQVNVVTKSGTNAFAGTFSGYFRDDRFNAADFVVRRVLPYSNQQVGGTFGGPIKKDKAHFFGHYEGEREPQAFTHTTPFPSFNIDLKGTRTEKKAGARFDTQFSTSKRLTVRANKWILHLPYEPRLTGGGSRHPSASTTGLKTSDQLFMSFTQTLGQKGVNEVLGGYNNFRFDNDGIVPHSPTINLRGLTMGKPSHYYQHVGQDTYNIRDNLTYVLTAAGHHEFKLGGEYLYNLTYLYWFHFGDGNITATGGPIPANIEDLFPVWNDVSTWNLAALSPITIRYQKSIGNYQLYNPRDVGAAWFQDNWAVTPRLTLNLGVRYDVGIGSLAERYPLPPFRPADRLKSDTLNLVPRFGFAYTLPDSKTVIRGGFGRYFAELTNNLTHGTDMSSGTVIPETLNDGRPNFAADPYNGRPPTLEEARRTRLDITSSIASPDVHTPYSYQTSIGFQRQLGETMAVEADYVFTGAHRELRSRNFNLSFNPATGANWPFTDISHRPYPDWGVVGMFFTEGRSTYHGLQTAFSKRFSHGWQASATYTLATMWDDTDTFATPDNPFDLAAEWAPSTADQRHRAVFNGIWQLPYGFQLSGLYFFGSGNHFSTNYGGDLRNTGNFSSGRLRPNGTIVPRNAFVGKPLHRTDVRVQRRFPIRGRVAVDGMFEVFNLFNHANYGAYSLSESLANYGAPAQNTNVAYQPRMLQLGFRFAF